MSGGKTCRIGPYLAQRRFKNRHSSGDAGKTATHFRATPPWWATCSWAHQGGIEAIPDLVLADRRVAVKRAFQNEWRIIVQNQILSGAMPFQKPPLIQEQHRSRWSVCPWPRQACHSFRTSTAPSRCNRHRQQKGAAGRCAAAPWSHSLPGHSATFQKLRRRGPCAWSFPLDTHPGLPQRFAARCPRHLGGRSGTRKAT